MFSSLFTVIIFLFAYSIDGDGIILLLTLK